MMKFIRFEKYFIIFSSLFLLLGISILGYRYFFSSEKIEVISSLPPLHSKTNNAIIQKVKSININTASEQELMVLPGIGVTLANRIIEYRKLHGKIYRVKELLNIKGIGSKRLEKVKKFIILE